MKSCGPTREPLAALCPDAAHCRYKEPRGFLEAEGVRFSVRHSPGASQVLVFG